MHVFEVTSLKTYSTGYFSKQQNESGYFCGMTLVLDLFCTYIIYFFFAGRERIFVIIFPFIGLHELVNKLNRII